MSEYTHIIHIADLHIRTGDPDRARIEEYKVVLDDFLKTVKDLPCVKHNTALTVIAGDVFHNKGRIESAGFKLFSRFVTRLSVLTPVVLICGNHDFRQEDPNIPDMLESMLDPWLDNERVRYLKDTGHYEFGNVGFGVVSVKDTLRFGNTRGIASKLPPFPSVGMFGPSTQHRIALFHGTVKSCRLQNGTGPSGGAYPLEWFQGYDMLLLGDVHKQQIHKTSEGMPWGYPGSLVQQDFGEGIFGHGFLLWDLSTRVATPHHIPNTFGLVTMRLKKDTFEYEVYTALREWTPLATACKHPHFPKRPMVRVYDASHTDTEEALKSAGVYARNIHVMTSVGGEDETTTEDTREEIEPLVELCQPQKWKEYMHQVAPHLSTEVDAWFDAPERMNLPLPSDDAGIPAPVVTKIGDRMNKITKLLHVYRDALGAQGLGVRNRIQLKKVAWDYTLCYGQDNYFDFEAIRGNIALLNGRNASGKSSFMEMLCLGLFGEQIRTRTTSGRKMSAKVIHSKKPQNKRAMNIRVTFSINDQFYEIIREFGTQAEKNVSQYCVELFAVDVVQNNKVLMREGTTAVNAWMEKHLGSMENVLMSNFITQLDQANFFMLKQEDQKSILERALHLESVTALAGLLHEARLGHTFVVSTISAVVETTLKMRNNKAIDRPEALEARLQRLETEWETKNAELVALQRSIGNVADDSSQDDETLVLERQECANLLDSLGDISEDDKKALYEGKGERQSQVRSSYAQLNALGEYETDLELDELYAMCEELEETLQRLERDKPPMPNTSPDAFKELKALVSQHVVEGSIEDMEAALTSLKSLALSKPSEDIEHEYGLGDVETLVCKFCELLEKKKELHEKRVISNYKDDEHQAWVKKYKTWLKRNASFAKDETTLEEYRLEKQQLESKIQVQEEVQNYMQTIDEIQKELETYAEMPFNGDCWACKQQPWRKIWDAKTKRVQELKASVKERRKKNKETLDDLLAELETLSQWIVAKDQYERQRDMMEVQNQQWDKLVALWKDEQVWTKEYAVVKKELGHVSSVLWCMRKDLEHKLDLARKICMFHAEKKLHADMRTWIKAYDPTADKLESLRKNIQWKETAIRVEELEQTLEIDQKKMERLESWDVAQKKIAWIDGVLAKRNADMVEQRLQELSHQIKETRMAYGHAQTEWEKHAETERMYEQQKRYLKELQDREQKLIELEQWFVGTGDEDGYKKWMYTAKVIPILQKELNACLKGVENLRMKIEYDKGGFTYLVEDGDRKPSLDKASGYQNFIISLCMRITLGRIGATRHDIRQLIIDEGFTSCDADNLTKMPDFLRTLLKNKDYDSVLLMSHLDGIRESTTMKIDIQQMGPFSTLRVGEEYTNVPVAAATVTTTEGEVVEAPKKTRGRPKKGP